MGKPPWVVWLEIPLKTAPGRCSLQAQGTTDAGTEVESNEVEIDIEPLEIPPVTFSQRALTVAVGDCVDLLRVDSLSCGQNLFVSGKYSDGTEVTLNRSTKFTVASQQPSIAKVWKDNVIIGVSAGTTKIVVFGKYTLDVTVVGKGH